MAYNLHCGQLNNTNSIRNTNKELTASLPMSLPPKLTTIHDPEPPALNSRFSWGLSSKPNPPRKAKIPEYLKAPLQTMYSIFSVFLLFAETMRCELSPLALHLIQHHAGRLEDVLVLSNNSDVPLH